MFSCALGARGFGRALPVAAACAGLFSLMFAAVAAAENPHDVVRVEEDWELVVLTPDADSTGPQVTCAISPLGHLDSLHATFELNHQTLPDFVPGGLQLQTWEGEYELHTHKYPNPEVMNTRNEVVRWTQVMRVDDGQLHFAVVGGHSTTWGNFGGQGYLSAAQQTSLDNLNAYSPATSVKHSGIPYAANRVKRLVLKRVRVVKANGDTHVDETDRVVHSLP